MNHFELYQVSVHGSNTCFSTGIGMRGVARYMYTDLPSYYHQINGLDNFQTHATQTAMSTCYGCNTA